MSYTLDTFLPPQHPPAPIQSPERQWWYVLPEHQNVVQKSKRRPTLDTDIYMKLMYSLLGTGYFQVDSRFKLL